MNPWIILLGAAIALAGCAHEEHVKVEESKFVITKPIKADTLVYREYVGQIHSIQHIELRTLERGYLQNVYVDEGRFVKKGQILFQIMPIIYQAELQKAEAEKNYVEIEYQTTKNLADSNIVSKNELALVKAKLDKAKAEWELAQAHLQFTEIRAPFDGIVGRFNDVRLGSLLEEGELLTTLSDNNKMWVYFNVPEAEYLDYITKLHAGNLPRVTLQLANRTMFDQLGVVETIEADFNNETGNIAFRATFSNPKGILRNGETGNIMMPVQLNNALLIPQKATFEILDKKYVYVVDKNKVATSREIKIGQELPHLYTIEKGLELDEKILVEGLRKVKNNQTIQYDSVAMEDILKDLHLLHAE